MEKDEEYLKEVKSKLEEYFIEGLRKAKITKEIEKKEKREEELNQLKKETQPEEEFIYAERLVDLKLDRKVKYLETYVWYRELMNHPKYVNSLYNDDKFRRCIKLVNTNAMGTNEKYRNRVRKKIEKFFPESRGK